MTDIIAHWPLYIVISGMFAFMVVLVTASIEDAMRPRR